MNRILFQVLWELCKVQPIWNQAFHLSASFLKNPSLKSLCLSQSEHHRNAYDHIASSAFPGTNIAIQLADVLLLIQIYYIYIINIIQIHATAFYILIVHSNPVANILHTNT